MTVKRKYSSPVRAEQTRSTRRAIVDSAAHLFIRDGYGATTIEAIAEAAGVSRKTVFNAAGGKLDVLKLALDWATVGDDEPVPLLERPEVADLASEPDPDAIIASWAAIIAAIASRVAALSVVLVAAAGIDAEARALRNSAQAQRHIGATAFVEYLESVGALKLGLDAATAADIVWLHSDPLLYDRLVHDRGWPPKQFEHWLAQTVRLQLIECARP